MRVRKRTMCRNERESVQICTLSRCFLRTNQGEQEEKYKEKVLKWKEKAEEFYLLKKNAKKNQSWHAACTIIINWNETSRRFIYV